MLFALLGSRAFHADALVRAPGPHLHAAGLADPLDANTRALAARRRVGPTDDFPLSALVGEAIADVELHRQDLAIDIIEGEIRSAQHEAILEVERLVISGFSPQAVAKELRERAERIIRPTGMGDLKRRR